MHPIIATSYQGFWLFFPVLALFILALPLGIASVLLRKRGIAIACGVIWLIFGLWTISAGITDDTSDARKMMIVGSVVTAIGLSFMLFRRKPARPPI
jgi:sugar phosphate permease